MLSNRVGEWVWDPYGRSFISWGDAIKDSLVETRIVSSGDPDYTDRKWGIPFAKFQAKLAKLLGDPNVRLYCDMQLDYAEERARKEKVDAIKYPHLEGTIFLGRYVPPGVIGKSCF